MTIHYICDACFNRILPVTPRFHCLVCSEYDSCQSCHMEGRFPAPHIAQHPCHITYVPSLATNTSQPTAAVVASAIPPPPPPPPPPPRSPRQPPSLPPRRLISQTMPNTSPQDQYWGYLIAPQNTTSQMLSRLADAIFYHFSSYAQTLTPEQLSAVYSAMGCEGIANFPQLLQSSMAQYDSTLDPADGQIAFVFKEYGYQYATATRAATNGFQSVPDGMPLLLRESFQKLLLDEILESPENAYVRLNTLFKNVPPLMDPATRRPFEYREIPRGCFPMEPDPTTRAKGERIGAALTERLGVMFESLAKDVESRRMAEELQAEANAREQLAAVKARIALEQRGRDNVLGGWRVDSYGHRYYDAGLI